MSILQSPRRSGLKTDGWGKGADTSERFVANDPFDRRLPAPQRPKLPKPLKQPLKIDVGAFRWRYLLHVIAVGLFIYNNIKGNRSGSP
jgi:hypothetical protein